MARIYLSVMGISYLLLAVWCALAPDRTSAAVGFALQPGSGESEYLVVYGGLQLALGITFLWPLYRVEATRYCLGVCLNVCVWLVVFRTYAFCSLSGFQQITYLLAGMEWLTLLCGLAVWWRESSQGEPGRRATGDGASTGVADVASSTL